MFLWKNVLSKFAIRAAVIAAVLYSISVYTDNAVLKYKEEQQKVTEALRKKLEVEVSKNAALMQRNTADLAKAKREYEITINDLNHEHTDRLRSLQERTNYYRGLSEASTAECRNLGNITTELDRNLVEGRRLVIELRERLELREQELRVIGKQLLADRKLLGQEHNEHK